MTQRSARADMQHRVLIASHVHPPQPQNTIRCTEGMWELRDDGARALRGKHRHGLHKRNTPEVGSVTLLYASLVEPQWAASARIDPRPPRGEGDGRRPSSFGKTGHRSKQCGVFFTISYVFAAHFGIQSQLQMRTSWLLSAGSASSASIAVLRHAWHAS